MIGIIVFEMLLINFFLDNNEKKSIETLEDIIQDFISYYGEANKLNHCPRPEDIEKVDQLLLNSNPSFLLQKWKRKFIESNKKGIKSTSRVTDFFSQSQTVDQAPNINTQNAPPPLKRLRKNTNKNL